MDVVIVFVHIWLVFQNYITTSVKHHLHVYGHENKLKVKLNELTVVEAVGKFYVPFTDFIESQGH